MPGTVFAFTPVLPLNFLIGFPLFVTAADWNQGAVYGYTLRRTEREIIYWVGA